MDASEVVACAGLLGCAIIHLLPSVGVLRGKWLSRLYHVRIDDVNVELLMRHRAVLFMNVGGLLLTSIVHRPLRPAAFTIAGVSVLSFLVLAHSGRAGHPFNDAVRRTAVADWIALGCLGAASLRLY
jgi:hypothetical protein